MGTGGHKKSITRCALEPSLPVLVEDKDEHGALEHVDGCVAFKAVSYAVNLLETSKIK